MKIKDYLNLLEKQKQELLILTAQKGVSEETELVIESQYVYYTFEYEPPRFSVRDFFVDGDFYFKYSFVCGKELTKKKRAIEVS